MKSSTSKEHSEAVLSIARIQRPRGFSGELRATFRGEFLEKLAGMQISLYHASGIRDGFLIDSRFAAEYHLLSTGFGGSGVAVICLEGVDSMESAESLKGLYIGLTLSEAKRLFFDPDEPYLFQYIDMKVFNHGKKVGDVLRIEEGGAMQWLIISYESQAGEGADDSGDEKNPEFKELMVPMNGPFIEKTDFEAGEIHIINLELLGA